MLLGIWVFYDGVLKALRASSFVKMCVESGFDRKRIKIKSYYMNWHHYIIKNAVRLYF